MTTSKYCGIASSVLIIFSIMASLSIPKNEEGISAPEKILKFEEVIEEKPIHVDLLSNNFSQEVEYIYYYTDEDIIMLSKLLYNECRGIPSTTEKACVVWSVLNRVDNGFGSSIKEVLTSPNQFAYSNGTPVWSELYEIAEDVLMRWNSEKNGNPADGRVLPSEYMWFYGDGSNNHFRNAYSGDYDTWDYRLDSPYES